MRTKNFETIIACAAMALFCSACSDGGGGANGAAADTQLTDTLVVDAERSADTDQPLDVEDSDAATNDGMNATDSVVPSDAVTTELPSPSEPPLVTLVTTLGEFTIELNSEAAPVTTANFLMYVEEGFYDGDDGLGATTFHRIIQGFMIQGGGVRADMSYKDVHSAIVNESTNGLKNVRGSVAMARKNDPDTATSQFFVNHVDNDFLDYTDAENPGYAVFGQVVSGMDVVDAIADVPTNPADMPFEPIEILNVFK